MSRKCPLRHRSLLGSQAKFDMLHPQQEACNHGRQRYSLAVHDASRLASCPEALIHKGTEQAQTVCALKVTNLQIWTADLHVRFGT